LGVEPILKDGELTLRMPYHDDLIGNPVLPAMHGGAVSAFMEITAILQLSLTGDSERLPRTVGINIDFLRRGHPKDCYARACIVRQGRRVANMRVFAWQDDIEKPITALHGNFMISQDD
jgi:uncharacterized protein (TIGR00369 family)